MITIKALNEFSKLVKEKTDWKIDIDRFYMFHSTSVEYRFGVHTTKCRFVNMTKNDCVVVLCDFIEGDIIKNDSFSIKSFDFSGYEFKEDALQEICNYSGINKTDLFLLSLKK